MAKLTNLEKKAKWEAVDWSKSPSEIAKDMGVSERTVYIRKKNLGVKPSTRGVNAKIDWSEIDWSKSTKQIMKETGYSLSSVDLMRSKLGMSKTVPNWDLVDWSLTDKEIAESLGKSEQHIYQTRKKFEAVDFELSDKGISEIASLMIKDLVLKAVDNGINEQFKNISESDIKKIISKMTESVEAATIHSRASLSEWNNRPRNH